MAKSGARAVAQERRERWRAVVGRWQASGLSQAEFFRRHGVAVWKLAWWRKRPAEGDGMTTDWRRCRRAGTQAHTIRYLPSRCPADTFCSMAWTPWHFLVVAIAGWVNRQQQVIEYLRTENPPRWSVCQLCETGSTATATSDRIPPPPPAEQRTCLRTS
jgi:hypothetical protein